MNKRSYVKDNVVYDCGLPKSPEECSAIINNLEEIASKWQHKCEEKDKQIIELKKQLNDLPKKIIEEIRSYYTTPIYDRSNAHTEVKVLLHRLNIVLKKYGDKDCEIIPTYTTNIVYQMPEE